MTRTLFFHIVLRKFSEITNNKPIFSQYNIFYNYEYFFFQSAFWSLFNHHQRSQSNQKQCNLCCGSPCFCVLLCTHYGALQCFSTYFRELKEIGVLRPKFPDYVISYDYGFGIDRKLISNISYFYKLFSTGLWILQVRSTNYTLRLSHGQKHEHCFHWTVYWHI